MKCKYCGGEMGLEDKVCPFCGQSNESAKPYVETMDRYENQLEQATQKVEKSSNLVRRYVVFLVVTIILALLNIVVVTLRAKSKDIRDWMDKKEITRNSPEYIERIDTALSNNEYILASEIYLHSFIEFPDEKRGINTTVHLAIDLNSIMEDGIYLTEPLVKDQYYTKEELVDTMAGHIKRYFESYNDLGRDYTVAHTTEHDQAQRDEIVTTFRNFMRYYIHLTDEEIDTLGELSKTEIAVLIGGRLGIYE